MTRSVDAGSVTIDLDITYTNIGDIYVTLTSPDGGQVVLHDNADSANDFKRISMILNHKTLGNLKRWTMPEETQAPSTVGL